MHLYGVVLLPVFVHVNTYSDFDLLRMEKNSAYAPRKQNTLRNDEQAVEIGKRGRRLRHCCTRDETEVATLQLLTTHAMFLPRHAL